MATLIKVYMKCDQVMTKQEFLEMVEKAYKDCEFVKYSAMDPDNFYTDYIIEGYTPKEEAFKFNNLSVSKVMDFVRNHEHLISTITLNNIYGETDFKSICNTLNKEASSNAIFNKAAKDWVW